MSLTYLLYNEVLRLFRVGLTANGWTTNDQCQYWFENVLVPQVNEKRLSPDERVLLIFDGHHSHLTDELYDLGCVHNIDFYLLPSHTTHKLQPLDIGCFGPMQKKWLERVENIVLETGHRVERDDFVVEYLKVRDQCVTKEVIMAAWRKTGLVPFNPDIFTEADFAPSRPFSTQSFFTPSFPCQPTPAFPNEPFNPVPATHDAPETGEDEPLLTYQRAPSPMNVDPPSDDPSDVNNDNSDTQVPGRHRSQKFIPTSFPPVTPLSEQVRILREDLNNCMAILEKEQIRCEEVEAHCTNLGIEYALVKGQLNAKAKRATKKERCFTSSKLAKFLSGPEVKVEREA